MTTNLQIRLRNTYKALFGKEYSIYYERVTADGANVGGHTVRGSWKDTVRFAEELKAKGYLFEVAEITPNRTRIPRHL